MLTLTRAVRVYACAAPVDMRKGFDGLSALVVLPLDEADKVCAACAAVRRRTARR